MRRHGLVAKTVAASAVTAALAFAAPIEALACTQVYVGSQLTASGDTIYGREEDFASRHVKVFGVQDETDGRTYISGESNFNRTVGHTYRYTYVRDTEADWGMGFPPYSEAGINENGVTCSATLTTDANDKVMAVDPKTDNGIGEYNLADAVLGEATSARDGVEKLGKVMDEYGTAEHNQIWIGDNNEVWNFQQLSGHQWIAIKVADNVASVNPNIGYLRYKVNLDDQSTCLHSEGIEDVARKADSYATFDDGSFDVATSYGDTDPGVHQMTRYAQGRAYLGAALGDSDFTVDGSGRVNSLSMDARQLFFTPGRSDYSLYDVQRLLAARGEGTQFDANKNTKLYAIGNNRGVESHLFQTRKGMSADIATIQWEALSRTEFSIYVPSYSALLTEVPTDVYSTYDGIDQSHTGKKESYDDVNAAMDATTNGDNMDYVMMDLNTLAYNNRDKVGSGVAAYLKALQTEVNSQQEVVDAYMQSLPSDQRTDAANKAFDAVSHGVYEKAKALRTEVREYLKGDQSKEFAASDLNSDGTLKDPLQYAAKVVPPTITGQPSSASYVQKDAATALSVDASDPAGTSLSYQWMKSTDGGKTWKKVATSDTYTPATTDEGEAQYKVVVTNEGGLTAESQVATISVSKPVVPAPTGSMYRVYNPNSGEHFYTASSYEAGSLVKVGWRYEGIGWTAPKTSKTPVYRLYNPNAGDHHYTTSAAERDMLVKAGWNDEGIGWYSDDAQTVPVYREYNPNAKAGAHNFTTNKAEDEMLANAGWNQEGIAWYGVKAQN